ncbi:MAG: membrane protein insertion efficiency factor YidD [Mycobacterium sp.]
MTVRSVGARGLIAVIQFYRNAVSPLRLPTCRFTPTCSQYAVDALTEFGLIRGGWLALVRLLKCGPWHNGGWDPIPDREADRGEAQSDCGVADHRTSTAQQWESQTRV